MGRAHVLDVKVRSSVAQRARARMVSVTLGVTAGTIVGLYLLWCAGAWALDQLVYENRSFAITQIDVQTDGVISPEQLRRWSKVRTGQNLFALDLPQVKRDLELVAKVKSVSLERILPGTLRIRVTEREPIAQINVPRPKRDGDGIELVVFQVDAEGWVMVPLDPRQRAVALHATDDNMPILSGINFSDLQPGRRIESPAVAAALRLIQEFDSSPMANLVNLQRLDVSSSSVLLVTTTQGSEITFALNDFDRQLGRWLQVHQECARYNRVIASLDLAVSENTPLRMQEAAVLPPIPPKNAKSTPRTRKHV